jgi:archaellum component FlaC
MDHPIRRGDSIMRKSAVWILAIVAIGLGVATFIFFTKYQRTAADFAQATTKSEQTRSQYSQAINEIATIQDSLNAIVLGEEAAGAMAAKSDVEVNVPPNVRDQVLGRIAMLKEGLERTKQRITDLDRNLKKSGVRIAGLQKMITGLKSSVAEKEEQIATLTTQVDTLQTQVAGLSVQVEDQTQQLSVKQQELATVYYTMGDKKELMTAGVVESKGGVLGFGKTLKPSGKFDENASTALDTDQESVIEIPAQNPRVLSAQPVSSYVIQPTGQDRAELRIVDPEAFRQVKHLVILTS